MKAMMACTGVQVRLNVIEEGARLCEAELGGARCQNCVGAQRGQHHVTVSLSFEKGTFLNALQSAVEGHHLVGERVECCLDRRVARSRDFQTHALVHLEHLGGGDLLEEMLLQAGNDGIRLQFDPVR